MIIRIVKDTYIDFMSKTFIASCISALLILVGAVSLITNGGPKLSIDFKGGTLVAVNFTEPVDINMETGIPVDKEEANEDT